MKKLIKILAAALFGCLFFASVSFADPGIGPGGYWLQDASGWRYHNGMNYVTNDWYQVKGHWYLFGSNSYMLKGWQVGKDGKRYYLAETSDASHPEGAMYCNETTPDGKRVDENGAEINGPVQRPNPYGQTCVEICLGEQNVYVYNGNTLVLSTPCVTGSVAGGHATPTGAYSIYLKEANRTLRGTNNDGSKYASFVNFWMPFNGGVGLHDATWRGAFGGQIYQTGGSHGCVNLPYDAAAALWNVAYVGMPVYVHD